MAQQVGVILNPSEIRLLLTSPLGEVSVHMLRQGIRVANMAKRFCPVDTGRLRSSIGVSQEFTERGARTRIGSSVSYCAYVELGTRYQHARPFLQPALYAIRGLQ